MIPHDEIMQIVGSVAQQVNREYSSKDLPPVILVTLVGALPFAGELMQRLEFDPLVSSIKASSYQGLNSTGHIKISSAPTLDLSGRDVLIIEDIVDTGRTMHYLRQYLMQMGAADVKMCTMLFKPEKFKENKASIPDMEEPEFIGRSIPNDFIVGFGLDYNEQGRCLKDIYVLDE